MKYHESDRKLILKELVQFAEEKGPDDYLALDLTAIKVGRQLDEAFVSALNELLREELVTGLITPPGPVIRLNFQEWDRIQAEIKGGPEGRRV
jgi:hypothetical protein